jgi:lipopolysaccharide export system permease protein
MAFPKFSLIQRYILRTFLVFVAVSLLAFNALFFLFDFFDRIDNIITENPPFMLVVQYFSLKIPLITNLMLPVACLAATLLTIGLLSKNSEITAMRASGIKLRTLLVPIFACGVTLAFISILLGETIVPAATRRGKEIYNIDIKQKDKQGWLSQSNIWWRDKNDFYSVSTFDSRTNTLNGLSRFKLSDLFSILERTDAAKAKYVDPGLGWTMFDTINYQFSQKEIRATDTQKIFPLPIKKVPADFYDMDTDPATMSFQQLRKYIHTQTRNGVAISGLYADLYDKFAFPFVCAIITILVFPFALSPSRSGSMAYSVVSSILIGFSFFAVHSFCIALGRAEFISPFFAAWFPNMLMAAIGTVLMMGAEAPR